MSEPYTTAQELALKSADAVIVSLKADVQKYMQAFTYTNEQNTQLQDELDKLRAELAAANALFSKWDALINHQFSGSREAMSALTEVSQETARHLYGEPPWPSRIDALLKGND